jgi:hypothetical protein
VTWQRQVNFDVMMEAGEGTYHAHMDLMSATRQSVAWKAGTEQSIAGFQIATEGPITATGWITTARGRRLAWTPIQAASYEYVIFEPNGPRQVTLAAASFSLSIGGDPGHTLIAPEASADPDLPALVVPAFALANEQVLLLHRPDPIQPSSRFLGS